MSQLFEVIVINDILGSSILIMDFERIKGFNLCALALARKVMTDGKPHSDGMWTVRLFDQERFVKYIRGG